MALVLRHDNPDMIASWIKDMDDQNGSILLPRDTEIFNKAKIPYLKLKLHSRNERKNCWQ